MMGSGRRRALIVLLALTALVAGSMYAYWHFLIRGPLAGATFHDFGEVPLRSEGVTRVEHTFNLTNRLGRPLNIIAIRPDCGCVAVNDMRLTLQPGDSFNLPVSLQARIGERTALIHILFADDTQATLRVTAIGKPQPTLRMANLALGPSVALSAEGTAEFAVALETYDTYDAPPLPTITVSHSNLSAEFMEAAWSLEHRPRDVRNAPTTWQAIVRVRFAGELSTLPAGATITFELPPARALTIGVRSASAIGGLKEASRAGSTPEG